MCMLELCCFPSTSGIILGKRRWCWVFSNVDICRFITRKNRSTISRQTGWFILGWHSCFWLRTQSTSCGNRTFMTWETNNAIFTAKIRQCHIHSKTKAKQSSLIRKQCTWHTQMYQFVTAKSVLNGCNNLMAEVGVKIILHCLSPPNAHWEGRAFCPIKLPHCMPLTTVSAATANGMWRSVTSPISHTLESQERKRISKSVLPKALQPLFQSQVSLTDTVITAEQTKFPFIHMYPKYTDRVSADFREHGG